MYDDNTNVSCYDTRTRTDLPLLDEMSLPAEGIYFIDASCKGGLSVREACSVESAARLNPALRVNVLFAGPVDTRCRNQEPLASLGAYGNVVLSRIIVDDFSRWTGLGWLLKSSALNNNRYPVLQAISLLKYITIFKASGVFVEMDMLSTRGFDELPRRNNWVGIVQHSSGEIGNGVFAASSDSAGRAFMKSVMRTMQDGYSSEWKYEDEVWLLRKALQMMCGKIPFNATKDGFSFTCRGALTLYASKFFYPIPCSRSDEYFGRSLSATRLLNSFTQQVCDAVTRKLPITLDSTYAQLMSEFCPKVHNYLVARKAAISHLNTSDPQVPAATATTLNIEKEADRNPVQRKKTSYVGMQPIDKVERQRILDRYKVMLLKNNDVPDE